MTKSIASLLFVCALIGLSSNSFAQKKLTEGKVTYEMSYGNSQLDPQVAAMLPTESYVYFKGDKSRMEQKAGMGMNTVVISDSKANTAVMLMDIMGNKSAIKMSPEDIEKENAKSGKSQIKLLDETKVIAGYICHKAELTNSKGEKTYIYYTKDIKAQPKHEFKDIGGFPMEYELKQPAMTIKMTVKKITEENVNDNLFITPSDYKETTMEEFQKSMGGMK